MITAEQAEFVKSLSDRNGHISPAIVIRAALPEDSPIHELFEWDDNIAAEAHRISQAQTVIRFVRLEIEIRKQTIVCPFYVPDPERPPKSRRYLELTRAARDAEIAREVLANEMVRVVGAIRRAKKVALVLGLNQLLDRLLYDIDAIQEACAGGRSRGRGRGKPSKKAA